MGSAKRTHRRKAFSLMELVIVVVIIGLLAAIAIPKLTHAAQSAGETALTSDMAILREAIDLYVLDHGVPPDADNVSDQLLKQTDAGGHIGVGTPTFIFGPYLKTVPPLPVGSATERQRSGIGGTTNAAWSYQTDGKTYLLEPNAGGVDTAGVAYTAY
jgi:type II secretion system protein G